MKLRVRALKSNPSFTAVSVITCELKACYDRMYESNTLTICPYKWYSFLINFNNHYLYFSFHIVEHHLSSSNTQIVSFAENQLLKLSDSICPLLLSISLFLTKGECCSYTRNDATCYCISNSGC